MRIIQVTTTSYFRPEYYGSNEHFLCRELTKLGHEVTVLTPSKYPKWQDLQNRTSETGIIECDGFTIHRLPAGPEVGIVPLMPTLLSTLYKMKFDIIHAHDYYAISSFYSAVVARAKGTPLIITQHNDHLPPSMINAFLYLFNNCTLGRYTLFEAKRIIALSSASRNHLLLTGVKEEKIEIIPNAVDIDMFSPYKKNLLKEKWGISDSVILFVGRLKKEKGLEHLLHAYSEVKKRIGEAKLVIIGEGPERGSLKKLQKKLGVSDVFFLGSVRNKFMPNIYVGCDVLVLPSISEPFGNVVIEAMATGKPVIGSYVGGMKDTIIHGVSGYHVYPGSIKQISKYLIKLLSNESLRRRLGKNARKRAIEEYNQKNVIKRIERLYTHQLFGNK